jgi:hypothetical protein
LTQLWRTDLINFNATTSPTGVWNYIGGLDVLADGSIVVIANSYLYKIRNSYEAPGHNLRLESKKVQQLMDDYVRSLKIDDIMDQREVTYDNFLGYASKFKTD